MAVHDLIKLKVDDGWVQLTNADATKITAIYRSGGGEVILQPTVGANAPAASDYRGLPIRQGKDGFVDGFLNETITGLTITASVTRVYARALNAEATLYVQTD